MKMQLTKIPSVVRRLHLPQEVEVGIAIQPEEGAVLVVEALADVGKNNMLEFTSGRIGSLVEGDIIPAVLGKRQALREYSGDIPASVDVGDILYLLCESGVVGEIRGMNEAYGAPLQVRVLGDLYEHRQDNGDLQVDSAFPSPGVEGSECQAERNRLNARSRQGK